MVKKRIEPGPFVVPMPTVLIGSMVEGKPNFMTAAFVGIVNFRPTVVGCGLNPSHLTCRGIEASGAFSLNLPSTSMVEKTDYCGLYSGTKVDKATLFDLFRGDLEGAPMISECRLTAECKLLDTIPFEIDTLYLGEVVSVFADEEVADDGDLDWGGIDPMIFTFPDKRYWKLGDALARAWKVGKAREK